MFVFNTNRIESATDSILRLSPLAFPNNVTAAGRNSPPHNSYTDEVHNSNLPRNFVPGNFVPDNWCVSHCYHGTCKAFKKVVNFVKSLVRHVVELQYDTFHNLR